MENLIYETMPGDFFERVAIKCKELSTNERYVQFDFNGITCIVSPETNLEYLSRDYNNAFTMDWKVVGHYCVDEYSDAVQKELDSRNEANKIRREKKRKESQMKDEKEKAEVMKKIDGVVLELKNKDDWDKSVENNKDPYGACAIEYAETWARLMQYEMSKGKSLIDCAKRTSHEVDYLGITGFMYGCAVNILSHCWKFGEELRQWHNGEYNHTGDGVVNPAILTIKTN